MDTLSPFICRCRSIYCALDWVTNCRIKWICDRHEAHIIGVDQ